MTAQARPAFGQALAVAPEMPRRFAVSRIGAGAEVALEATPEERASLARRMKIVAIGAFTCRFDLRCAGGDTVEAHGTLHAQVRQNCVVTLEPFDAEVLEDFTVRFVPAGTENEEIDLEGDDEIGYEEGMLDLGEAASEQLALALDPFPRKPGAELFEASSEQRQGAFAALARLMPARHTPDTADD